MRRHHVLDAAGPIEGAYFSHAVGRPTSAGVFSFDRDNVLEPFHPLNAYLWLGAGIAFALVALVVFVVAHRSCVISARRSYVTALAFVGAGVACLVVTLVRRHAFADTIDPLAHATTKGWTAYAPLALQGNVLDPFRPLNPYLWLGAMIAFALGASALGVSARLTRR